MNIELKDYFNTLDKLGETAERLPAMLATHAKNFSQDRFRQQNWLDNTTENWKPRKATRNESKRRKSRSILIDTARLRNSIRIVYVGKDMIIIGTDVPYAKVHNFGFKGKVKQQVSSHNRKTRQGRTTRVRSHSRTIYLKIPKRQFIGNSAVLQSQLARLATSEFMKALKK